MGVISKKNFIPTVCVVYTALSLCKIAYEATLSGNLEHNYENFLWMLAISVMATFVLSLHPYLQKLPIWLVILGQYLVLITLISLFVWIEGHFAYLHPDAYGDMFWSVTIPYPLGAAVYYFSFWLKVKKANVILKDLKEKRRRDGVI